MKKILITGANSYIGTSFKKWMTQFQDEYQIDTLSVRGDAWREHDFSRYDTVFHVAGIAHADVSKVSEETKQLYYAVNRDLAIETAKKYKQDLSGKNGQFIYMSSIIIYGEETNINKKRVITPDTKPNPSNFYGDSKLQAEIGLQPLDDDTFHVAILRPPMIYGPGSKGNFPELVKLADKLPVFPAIKNQRSMLFIENLCMYLKEIIDEEKNGIFFPQNNEYVRTSDIIQTIAKYKKKKTVILPYFNYFVKLLGYFPGKVGRLTNKAFGNLVYAPNERDDRLVDFEETIKKSIGYKNE
ncbi:TPA: NAD-dependent epimerase/dehydratase family protein [Enterococcus faecium]|nr:MULTISPECIES: NAD-dependent epimerase/dehydratase family protein [Enterococcus]EEI59833.1 NAD dependent epimerase/dehydratase family protein [Enterococcus faecium TX1330]EEV58437.1 NAD-dependent epimerase/dehydratase [Enterococcus faecium Com12]EFF61323.1 NAD dependent epimerase/dehydratase family protein [Enterococcus faecium PC4.1]EGP4835436.1 NAD-dependent epimerase/dehydratase family protein [Enterococcus faecium]EGP4852375.1 NAD-dependent epimerase/dehydratase family protein [Enterococ